MLSILLAAAISQAEIDDNLRDYHCENPVGCIAVWTPKAAKSIHDTMCILLETGTNKIIRQWPSTETPHYYKEDDLTLYESSCDGEKPDLEVGHIQPPKP